MGDQMKQTILFSFRKWYSALPVKKASGGPARGTITAALVVLEHLRASCNLNLRTHLAKGGAQIRGLSKGTVKSILHRHGEDRPLLQEGGRTNRGNPEAIGEMLAVLDAAGLRDVLRADRESFINAAQFFLVGRICALHNRSRLKPIYNPSHTTWQIVSHILALSKEQGKEGPVAQYLVGAKLALRFPAMTVPNHSYSTADAMLHREGDFQLGTTAFHVTVAPSPEVFERCRANLAAGLRTFLLVPDRFLDAARQMASLPESDARSIAVEAIESFVGTNVEELSAFDAPKLKTNLTALIKKYNERVNAVENDKSMLIDIPPNL